MKEICNRLCHHNTDLGLLILRIIIGGLFIYHGTMKLSDMSGTVGFFNMLGYGVFWAWVVSLLETIGGVAILIGYGDKIASSLLSIQMIFIIVFMKRGMPIGKWELDLVFLAGTIAIMIIGSGKYALAKKLCSGKCCSGCQTEQKN